MMGKKIHMKKLFNGRHTAQEVHKIGLAKSCNACGSPAATTLRVFASFVELNMKFPGFLMDLAARTNGQIPLVDMRGPGGRPVKYVRVAAAFSCEAHRRDLEKEAVKIERQYSLVGLGNIIVDFDNGPGPDKPMVQVQ